MSTSTIRPRPIVLENEDTTETYIAHTDGKLNVGGIDKISQSNIYGATRDGKFQAVQLDTPTHTLQTIDYAHHEIHVGRHFMYTDAITLADTATQVYLITTPDTTRWAHIWFDLQGSAITQFELYEGADRTGTAAQTIGNNNRNSDIESGLAIHKGVSAGSTDGTLLFIHKGGSANNQSRAGSTTGNDEEIILKQNTKYILKVTSSTASNLINIKLEWYEHINRDA